ncbi:MAG: prenyltransferase/squalene oxidase repeat-containing protein [Planctomycetota bacterium]|nr:prenyltransferase/squalene oxidase repeat-containing protein [Planctomycetota bacterium]
MRLPPCRSLLICVLLTTPIATATEPGDPAKEEIQTAIRLAIPRLQEGAAGSAKKRQCFTCHNQAMPVLALATAQRKGFMTDHNLLKGQVQHTVAHLRRGQQRYLEGRGQGGQVITAGYALWALQAGGYAPDTLTTAVTGYLLQYQKDASHWSHPGSRPPSTGSDFTTTYVALRGLSDFGSDAQRQSINDRQKVVLQWLATTPAKDTEDRVFALRMLNLLDADQSDTTRHRSKLLELQQTDGGWAQTEQLNSDAYATGSVLAALLETGNLDPNHKAVQRGIAYLIKQQNADGSWHTITRAEPFQTYYESGFPHGKDQFISIAASSWATLALLLTLPDVPEGERPPAAGRTPD